MATITELEKAEELHRIDPALPPEVQELRVVHASTRLMRWLSDSLPKLQSDWSIELSPAEQMAILIENFCSGQELAVGLQFKCLQPAANGIWELKTQDLRVFGWFYARDCFVAAVGDTASRIKKYGLYHGYIIEALRLRERLQLEPEHIAGEEPHAVVSNYSYP